MTGRIGFNSVLSLLGGNQIMSESKNVHIQDYIIAVGQQSAASADYEVVLENNTDFIIARNTASGRRELVILISQGLFYYREKNGKTTPVRQGTIKTFLRGLLNPLELKEVNWLSGLDKDSANDLEKVIFNQSLVEMCQHNGLAEVSDPEQLVPYWEQNKKLLMRLLAIFPSMKLPKYHSSIPLIYAIETICGYNEALHFAEELVKSSVKSVTLSNRYYFHGSDEGIFQSLVKSKDYNLNMRRFTEFVLFDLFSQGLSEIDLYFWREYRDYLELQKKLFGKIKEKYPAHFKTEHDILVLKRNTLQEIITCENFAMRADEVDQLAYQQGAYCIAIPRQPEDLADEGVNLSHCVKDYIPRVADGECHILFLRKARHPDKSLVTLQVTANNLIQAEGLNRRPVTKEERHFLQQWCTNKKLGFAI